MMTEKDKIIQDLRRDNDHLHVLIREYIEGVKSMAAENKRLRAEKAAAEKAAAHRWPLSRAEVSLIAEMDAREARHEHEDPQDL